MKFALVNGQRQEAQPNLSGECPGCGSPMVARCGEVRVRHWAHKGRRYCDQWWEPETEWHRNWKGQFPVDWQEIVICAEDGERHIADVKTDAGWILEFQHSPIKPDERRSRETFYQKLVWVVDATRRKNDRAQFSKAWGKGTPVGGNARVRRVFSDECRLLHEWSGSPASVLFDFGNELGWLLGNGDNRSVHVAAFPRAVFIGIHRGEVTEDFDSLVKELRELVTTYESPVRRFAQYPACRSRNRRRL